jgi:glycosyltransferase involved in cell wall biosynthesis
LNNKKKILILIEWFSPGYKAGGPIQSCINICVALQEMYEIFVLTTDTDHGETVPYNNLSANKWIQSDEAGALVYYARKPDLSARQIKKIIDEVQPDFIYLNLLFSPHFVLYPLWLQYTGKLSAKVIVCPRGCLYDSALSLKYYKKKPLLLLYKWLGIHKNILFHATNTREEKAIQQYFPESTVIVANNLPNVQQHPFVSSNKLQGKLDCIFIARLVPIKNLLFLLKALLMVKAKIVLTIAGPVEDEVYWETCKQQIAQLPSNIQCNYIGPQANEQLYQLLLQNHLFVLPTTGENFGHAIIEALLAGRPVLISDQTPWLNLTEQQAGWQLPLDNIAAFAAVIEAVASYNQEAFDSIAGNAWQYAHNFSQDPHLTKPYLQLFS